MMTDGWRAHGVPSRERLARPLSDSLDRALQAAARRDPSPLDALEALALLDPVAAVRWLTDYRDAVEGVWSFQERRKVASQALRAFVTGGHLHTPGLALAFVEMYGSDLEPDAVVTCATQIPMGAALLDEMLDGALQLNPDHAPLLWVAAERAIESGRYAEAHQLLTRLGQADPSPTNLAHVFRVRERLPSPGGTAARIALLGSSGVDRLVPHLDLACRSVGIEPMVHVAPAAAWEHELLSADSELLHFGADVVFLLPSAADLLAGLDDGTLDPAEGRKAVARIVEAARAFRARSDALLVVHTLWDAHPEPLAAVHAPGTGIGPGLASLNAALARLLAEVPAVRLLDVGEVLARRPSTPSGGDHPAALANAWVRYIAPLRGLTRTCIVLDLDNTLWHGSVAEGGVHAVHLGDGPPGSAYRDFQRYLRDLARQGFTLAVVSKNEEAAALEVIRAHPGMILRERDFRALKINWRSKPENVAAIADELGIGTDEMVFLDDNPYERELMRRLQPGVLVPDLPRDPSRYRECVEALPQLQRLRPVAGDGGALVEA